jgi:hypothetical protein
MRRHLVALSIVFILIPFAKPADAGMALSPRGILGAIARPLHGLLGRHAVSRHRSRPAAGPNSISNARISPGNMDSRNLYEVFLGYVFWPNEFEKDFNRFGYHAIVLAALGAPAAGVSTNFGIGAHVATTGENLGPLRVAASFLPACDFDDTSASDWLAVHLESTLRPDAAQGPALETLRSKLIEGTQAIRFTCHETTSGSPAERLTDLEERLWAVYDADLIAHPAIEAFYDSLTDQQQARFIAPAPALGDSNDANAQMGRRYQACATQSADDTERLIDKITKTTRPTPDQQASLENLRTKSSQMEKLLLASCAQPIPDSIRARLDAVNGRLFDIISVANNLQLELNDFYGSLDDEQKAAFDRLGH